MNALVLSGLGPMYFNSTYLAGTMLDPAPGDPRQRMLAAAGVPDLALDQLAFSRGGEDYALLRPQRDEMPHLTTFTLRSILQRSGHDHEHIDLQDVWSGRARIPDVDIDVVLLSTSYIWNRRLLARAVAWVEEHLPGMPLVTGGQYTNLKFAPTMHHHPSVVAVIRGDGERSIPAALDAARGKLSWSDVPNAVWRDGDRIRINAVEYVDLEEWPSPGFTETFPVVPYESMRGCPFDCKYCSFPAASPKWRYKSASKIRDDWMRYAEHNGSGLVSAMDSTFTIPPVRLRELLEILPSAGVAWEGYSRANTIVKPETVQRLQEAHCTQLHIGFESMHDTTLQLMSKRVTAKQNRQAMNALRTAELGHTVFFMVGFPGETPEMFTETSRFLAQEYDGHFMLNLFTITDETMPLWEDRERLQIRADDPDDPDSPWSHIGMTSRAAAELQTAALDETRRHNDNAVYLLWQRPYQHWFLPHLDRRTNLAVEKCVERLALVTRDHTDVYAGAAAIRTQLAALDRHGVHVRADRPLRLDAPV